MTNKPKRIGTEAETGLVKYLRLAGWPYAERRALSGSTDKGDITGTAALCWEVKAGEAAYNASDNQISDWLAETEIERVNAKADYGILVVRRKQKRAEHWWAIVELRTLLSLHGTIYSWPDDDLARKPVRMRVADICRILARAGYGNEIADERRSDNQEDSAAA